MVGSGNSACFWAGVGYEKQRKAKLRHLEHHMEELYSGSWLSGSHARAALACKPDLLKLCAFLLQYGRPLAADNGAARHVAAR